MISSSDEQQRFPVCFNETAGEWVVKMPDREVTCALKSEARAIAAIPVLLREALELDLDPDDEDRSRAFVRQAKETVRVVNLYSVRCLASRDLERAVTRLEQTLK